MATITGVAQAREILNLKEAEELIGRVFEVWENFDKDAPEGVCPECGGIERGIVQDHEEWCWFSQARKWLESNSLKVPGIR